MAFLREQGFPVTCGGDIGVVSTEIPGKVPLRVQTDGGEIDYPRSQTAQTVEELPEKSG